MIRKCFALLFVEIGSWGPADPVRPRRTQDVTGVGPRAPPGRAEPEREEGQLLPPVVIRPLRPRTELAIRDHDRLRGQERD